MPCPKGVTIPEIFKLYKSHKFMKSHWVDKGLYIKNFWKKRRYMDKANIRFKMK